MSVPTFLHDFRHAVRQLRNSRGFSAVAVATIAVTVGANTAMFSLVNGMLLRPLPYPDPDRIVRVLERLPSGGLNGVSTLNYLDWTKQNTVFEYMAAEAGWRATLTGWDQFGARLLPGPDRDWSGGMVTGLAPGVARITASLTIANRTLTDSMTVKVGTPTAGSVVLRMDQYGHWSPYEVSLKAPATVTWVIPDGVPARTIWLNVWSANAEKLEFVHGVATRTFSKTGWYYYGTGGAHVVRGRGRRPGILTFFTMS